MSAIITTTRTYDLTVLLGLIDTTPERLMEDKTRHPGRWNAAKISKTVARIYKKLQQLPKIDNWEFPSAAFGQKNAYTLNRNQLRRIFGLNFDGQTSFQLYLVKKDENALPIRSLNTAGSSQNNQSIINNERDTLESLDDAFMGEQNNDCMAHEEFLSDYQKEAVKLIKEWSEFNKEDLKNLKVQKRLREKKQVDLSQLFNSLSTNTESSGSSWGQVNLSDRQDVQVKLIDDYECKKSCVKLVLESNMTPAMVNRAFMEIQSKLPEGALHVPSERSIRRHLFAAKYLIDEQLVRFINRSELLSIGIDTTTMSGFEYVSYSIRDNQGNMLIMASDNIHDHKAETVKLNFQHRFENDFSIEVRKQIAEKTALFQTDSAATALLTVEKIKKFLDEIHPRERTTIRCSMHKIGNSEKDLRKDFYEESSQILEGVEKYFSRSRLSVGKSSVAQEYSNFLRAKYPEKKFSDIPITQYSNVRFGTMVTNVEHILLYWDAIQYYFEERAKVPDIALLMKKFRDEVQVELSSFIMVYTHIIKEYWSVVSGKGQKYKGIYRIFKRNQSCMA